MSTHLTKRGFRPSFVGGMPKFDPNLSPEARSTLRKEWIDGLLRSLAISTFFAVPAAYFQPVAPKLIVWISFAMPIGVAIPLLKSDLFQRMKHRSFLVTILQRSVFYGIAFYLCSSLSLIPMFLTAFDPKIRENWFQVWKVAVTHPGFLASMVGAVILVVPVSFFFALSRKLGPGVLGKWMRGYYHEPRQEERIFMFLDMKDSTTLAERLGELKFSALVRDFFLDLTLPVLQTKAEVSHYIGDEAVLTWTLPNGIEKANCLRIFFEFEKAIERRRGYYLEAYGLVPEFKAGVHCGRVVATEVGEVKSEIVYHGDVLNTAARIQGLCNQTGERLLISEELNEILVGHLGIEARKLGQFELKGKEERVGIVAIGAKASILLLEVPR